MTSLTWKKYYPLSDKNAFICLVDHMGDDSSIVQAARVSYGKDKQDEYICTLTGEYKTEKKPLTKEDRQLIRYLLRHSHTTPFEMVEIKFMVQVPMDCWRQWIRHRTASVNEYSTRYAEAIDECQATPPEKWRLQATNNKQGSSGYLEEWPEEFNVSGKNQEITVGVKVKGHYFEYILPFDWWEELGFMEEPENGLTPGAFLTWLEYKTNKNSKDEYNLRLCLGVAKEQARKDLPLSTYTRAYWKCDLHNIFNFLRLRMDSHAQLEIRSFANCMFEIVKQICPIACEAFEDYVLHARRFSKMEMELIRTVLSPKDSEWFTENKPSSMTDREWKEFLTKLS